MKKYFKELEVYSGIAILFVVLIHSNSYYISNILGYSNYIEAGFLMNFADKLVHIAVPMFIFIAGFKYEINDKDKDYKCYVNEKFKKVGVPFLLVSILIILINYGVTLKKMVMNQGNLDVFMVLENVAKDFLKIFIGYNYAFQLWYIPLYFCIIILYPIFLKLIKNDRIRLIFFVVTAITVALIYGMHIQQKTFILIKYPYPFKFLYYFYLFDLGTAFFRNKLYLNEGKKVIIIYIIILFFNTFLKDIIISGIIYDVILIPIAVIAYYYIAVKIRNNKVFQELGKYSFFIFLFHEPIFLKYTFKLLSKFSIMHNYLIVIFSAVSSILLSIVFYKTLKKINTMYLQRMG